MNHVSGRGFRYGHMLMIIFLKTTLVIMCNLPGGGMVSRVLPVLMITLW